MLKRILESFQHRLHWPPQHSSWNWIRPCCLGEPGRCLGYILLFNNIHSCYNLGGRVAWTNLKWDRPLQRWLLREHTVLRQRAYFWLILNVGTGVAMNQNTNIYNIYNFRFFPRNGFSAFVFEVLSFNFRKYIHCQFW